MLNIKRIVVAIAIALVATMGSVAPAEAGGPQSTKTGGWCC
ncbi:MULTISPECIES: hypothetical protein [Nocardioides]|uniref:Uncharacterized protein n=1 Tax=Nocardioides vastitatis TaxID=2568655 RepID=A0ABW0ZI17_9ACTN|nr:hypothetical protein [Nocardioides sp.]